METPQTGYRLPPPESNAKVVWPEGFGARFMLVVDVEESFDWNAPFRRDAHDTHAIAALPGACTRFASHVPFNFLIDYPVVHSPRAVEILRPLVRDGRSAIGAQLHPWVTPPFKEVVNGYNSFAGNLDPGLEAAKLRTLTAAIIAAFDKAPRLYRAGRYSIGPHSFEILAALGYRADTSVRARYDYSPAGGPDFSDHGNAAFRTGPNGAILELPFTTVFTGSLRRRGQPFYQRLGRIPKGRAIAARSGLFSRASLTPEGMSINEALEAVRVAVGEGEQLLNFAFHSPSLVAGNTPYVRDASDLARFWRWWDRMLNLLERLNVRPISLDELLNAAGGLSTPGSSAIVQKLGACSSMVRAGRS